MRASSSTSLRIAAVGVAAVSLWSLPRAAGSAHSATVGSDDLHFAPAPGWAQTSATGMRPPAPQVQSTIAANVPIKDPPGVAHADETVQDLPAPGIVITASVSVPSTSNGASFPERSLPLRLADADVFVLDVRVFFGSQEPDAALVSEAQAELDRLAVPSRES